MAMEHAAVTTAVIGRVGTTTLNSITQGATHDRPRPPDSFAGVNRIGEAISRYSVIAIPRLAITSNARPKYSLAFAENRGEPTSSATATPPTTATAMGTQRLGRAKITAR